MRLSENVGSIALEGEMTKLVHYSGVQGVIVNRENNGDAVVFYELSPGPWLHGFGSTKSFALFCFESQ